MKIVTLNFWGSEPPLDRRLLLAVQQLRALAPDVICLQEVVPIAGEPARTTAHAIAGELGMHACYAASCTWQAGEGGMTSAGEQGLAIVSRAPLVETRTLALPRPYPADARALLSGLVASEGGLVWVHTTHLHYRRDDGVSREQQVVAIDAAIRALGRGNTDAPQILCGDFNATPDSDEMRFMRGLTTLDGRRTHFQDAWLRVHREAEAGDGPSEGMTWSSDNELTRALRSLDIDRRIDYVLVTSRKKDGRGTIRDCRVVLTGRDLGICASDHYGVYADVQVAPNA